MVITAVNNDTELDFVLDILGLTWNNRLLRRVGAQQDGWKTVKGEQLSLKKASSYALTSGQAMLTLSDRTLRQSVLSFQRWANGEGKSLTSKYFSMSRERIIKSVIIQLLVMLKLGVAVSCFCRSVLKSNARTARSGW